MKLSNIFAILFCLSGSYSVALPSGNFSVSRETAGSNVPIEFRHLTEISEGLITSYEWEMGDGTTYVGLAQITHQYSREGEYKVRLNVKDMDSNSATATRTIQVKSNLNPTADFHFKRQEIVVGEEVYFTSKAKDKDGEIEKYEWILDSNLVFGGSGDQFVQKFISPGNYTLTHKVVDNLGGSGTISKTIEVYEQNISPELLVEFPEDAVVGNPISIKVKSKDKDGKIVKATWQIDGMPEVEFDSKSFLVTFGYEKNFLLKVKVIDDRGGETIAQKRVFAQDLRIKPKVNLVLSSSRAIVRKAVGIQAEVSGSRGALVEVNWDFGDGNVIKSGGLTTDHTYLRSGTYKVSAEFTFDKNVTVKKDLEISVLDELFVRTVPTEVVLNDREYIELAPTQKVLITYSAYNQSSEFTPSVTPVWTPSNSVMTVVPTTGGAWVTGVAPGQTTLSVIVDGVTSQTIDIKVIDFVNTISVTKKGKFVGANHGQYCVFLDRTTGTYRISHEYRETDTYSSNFGVSGAKYYNCFDIELPVNQNKIPVITRNTADQSTSAYTKTEIQTFYGRKGFLYFPEVIALGIGFSNEDRFVNWDDSFTLTYWALANEDGQISYPSFHGKAIMTGSGGDGSIQVSANFSTKYIHAPKGPEFKNRWMHVAATYSANSATSGVLKYYIDGNLIGSMGVTLPTGATGGSMSITGRKGTAIDELKFFRYAMSSPEIASELFSPVNPSSSDIIAAFSFDSGMENHQASDSGPNWDLYWPVSDGSKNPQVKYAPNVLINQPVYTETSAEIVSKVPYSEYGNQKYSVQVHPGAVSQPQNLYVQGSSCLAACSYESMLPALTSSRHSLYYYVGALKYLQAPILLRIPFDPQSISTLDIGLLKVIQKDLNGFYELLEPTEINSQEGYVAVKIGSGGTFWLTKPGNFTDYLPVFTNADLHQAMVPDIGRRDFYAHIPSVQVEYTLKLKPAMYDPFSYQCSPGVSVSFDYYLFYISSVTFGNLPSGRTYCYLQYNFGAGYDLNNQWQEFYFFDAFIIDKD